MIILKETKQPCIYVITNLINNKQYVGQTTRFRERMWEHEKDHRTNSVLHQAIEKYGTDNFQVDIVEECAEDQLNEREIYWINQLGTYHVGYNLTRGGDGHTGDRLNSRRVIQYSYDYKTILHIYDSLSDAGRAFEKPYQSIRACCLRDNGHGGDVLHTYGYGWRFEDGEDDVLDRQKTTWATAFYAYELNDDKTLKDVPPRLFYIQAEAGRILHVNAGSIKSILRGNAKTTQSVDGKRYTFKWAKDCEV